MLHTDWPWYQEQMEIGRNVVTSTDPDELTQPEFLDAWLYYKDQEATVAARGRCEGNCLTSELRECNGKLVCDEP